MTWSSRVKRTQSDDRFHRQQQLSLQHKDHTKRSGLLVIRSVLKPTSSALVATVCLSLCSATTSTTVLGGRTRWAATLTPVRDCIDVGGPVCACTSNTYVTRCSSVHGMMMKCCATHPAPNNVCAVDSLTFAPECFMQGVSQMFATLMPEAQVCLLMTLLAITCWSTWVSPSVCWVRCKMFTCQTFTALTSVTISCTSLMPVVSRVWSTFVFFSCRTTR